MLTFEPVTEQNFRRIVQMKLPPEQERFVAPNVYSLAQAWLYPEARPFALTDGDEVVGFMMLDWDEEGRSLGIWRFMIAPEHQRKGYGRQAMLEVIRMAKESGLFDSMDLDYHPDNQAARALYASVGFEENGEQEEGEIVMVLRL